MIIYRIYEQIFKFTRKRRMRRLQEELRLTEGTRVIDLGGTPHNWSYLEIRPPVTLVKTDPRVAIPGGNGQFSYELGDACTLAYEDRAFDLAFSNSLIEHVGDYERQKQFAGEVHRVAEKVWVQTTARSFFIEPHYLTLFIHWLRNPGRSGSCPSRACEGSSR